MELNSVDKLSLSNIDHSSVNQLKHVNKVELNSNNRSLQEDKVEFKKQSSLFANNLMHNVKKIASVSTVQSVVSKQLDITTEIKQSIHSVIANPSSGQTLSDIQPKIKNLMDNFNHLSSIISNNMDALSSDSNETPKSRIYFDGILGAKPLSSKEIFEEVNSQKERLQKVNEAANDEILNTIQKSKKMFDTQKQELVAQQPQIKKIDFAIESNNFEPQSVQKVKGSVVDTQANAQTEQNIKLLAS